YGTGSHFAIFSLHSAAMNLKNGFVRTQNQQFSPPKHHLQTSTEPSQADFVTFVLFSLNPM
ncbi:MAG: hypothetical protein J5I98_29775, partial [Phaeodactylibacter sp.]|nr:hypothetical protein [Phaeodactylibacter sp.]